MAVGYNLTGIVANSTSYLQFIREVDGVLMGGWLGPMFLIGLSAVLFMSFQFSTGDPAKSFTATAYLSFLISLFMAALDLLPPVAIFITLIGAGIAAAFGGRRT